MDEVPPDAGDADTRVEWVTHQRSLVTRPDMRTDAASLSPATRGVVSALGVAVQGLVRFVYSLLVGRLLPVGFLSAVNSAISTALLATMLWPTSLGAAAGKFIAREAGDLAAREALTRYLLRLFVLTATPLGLGAGLLTYFVLRPGQLATATFVALLTVGWSGYTFVRGAQYATGRVLRASFWDCLSFVISVGGLVLVLIFDLRAWLLLPLTVGYLLYTAAGWPRTRPGSLDPVLRSEINRFVAWGVLGSLATGGFLQLTMVLAHQTGDVVSADAYAAALTLATPASMLGSVLGLLVLPALSTAVGRGDLNAVHARTDIANRGLITVVGGVFGVLVVGSRLLVALIWPQLSAAVPVLQILLVATFLLTAATVVTESIRSYSAHGARTVGIVRTIGFAVGLAVAVALIPAMSVLGIALGYLVGMGITSIVPTFLVWRRGQHAWGPLMTRFSAGAAVAAALVAFRTTTTSAGWLDGVMVAVFVTAWMLLHGRDLLNVARRSVNIRPVG